MGFLAALATLAGPLTARVLLALGFSVVTVAGVAAGVSQVKGMVLSWLGQGPADAIAIAGLAGVWVGLGLIFGAMTFITSMWGLTQAKRIIGVA